MTQLTLTQQERINELERQIRHLDADNAKALADVTTAFFEEKKNQQERINALEQEHARLKADNERLRRVVAAARRAYLYFSIRNLGEAADEVKRLLRDALAALDAEAQP